MNKFFTTYDKIKKWLALATFMFIYIILSIPINFPSTQTINPPFFYRMTIKYVSQFNDPNITFSSEFNRYNLILTFSLLLVFVILTIITLIQAFREKNFPICIAFMVLIIPTFLNFNWHYPELSQSLILANKNIMYQAIFYRTITCTVFALWLILDILSALRKKILAKSRQ